MNRNPVLILGGVFLVSLVLGAAIAPAIPNLGFKDAAAVLAFAGLGAAAIERVIEGMYTAIAGRLGEWWPLSVVKSEFDSYETQTNQLLGPVFDQVKTALETAKKEAGLSETRLAHLEAEIAHLDLERQKYQGQLDDATKKLAPGTSRLRRLAEIGTVVNHSLATSVRFAGEAGSSATSALRTVSDEADRALLLIKSFDDNPARRIASLALGMSFGMLLAGGVGLNLFAATIVAGDASGLSYAFLAGKLGIVLTGVIIGLGSGPTHEIVKSLQEYKDARKGGEIVPTVGAVASTAGEGPVPRSLRAMRSDAIETIAIEPEPFHLSEKMTQAVMVRPSR